MTKDDRQAYKDAMSFEYKRGYEKGRLKGRQEILDEIEEDRKRFLQGFAYKKK